MSDRNFIERTVNKFTSHVTTLREKILLIAVPLLVLTSIAYTLDALMTERSIMREEILKKAGVVTDLASQIGELPLISENPEHIKKAISSLSSVSEISFVAFYNKNSELLGKEGDISGLPEHHTILDTEIIERNEFFDLCTPVFTIKPEEDIDIFEETGTNPETKEHVGWIRLGFSKAFMKKAEKELIYRAVSIALVFIIASSILVYKLTSAATRPLTILSNAAKSMRKGEYPELEITSDDEIGTLTAEFNSMSATIHEREEMLKESLSEKELLLREVHHRVKNNMQIISSLLNLQSEHIKEEKYLDMFKESRNRIRSMALVHEKLYQSPDLASIDLNDYINTLITSLISSYEKLTRNISLNTDIDQIAIGVDTAIPCGLIINELITNSLKHAFPDGRKGTINISIKKSGTGSDADYDLIISDNGTGIPEGLDIRKTQSLGLKLITTLIEHQLQGSFELKRDNGTEFRINFKELKYKKRV